MPNGTPVEVTISSNDNVLAIKRDQVDSQIEQALVDKTAVSYRGTPVSETDTF
jgi:hypothetical protein